MKVYIKKFGPIKDVIIEFAPMIVFTGNSNLGKSYVNYLMYYLVKSTSTGMLSFFLNKKMQDGNNCEFSLFSIQKFINSKVEDFMRDFLNAPELICDVQFDLKSPNTKDTYRIDYKESNVESEEDTLFGGNEKSVQIHINDEVYSRIIPVMPGLKEYSVEAVFSQHLQKELFGHAISQAFIMPPARGAFVGENYTLKEKISSSVGMYRMFLNDYDRSTQRYQMLPERLLRKYSQQIESIVGGKLVSKDGKQSLKLRNGVELPLSATASSIKEMSPLLYSLQATPKALKSFCIEEPEAHLHPQMQLAVIDLLATCFNEGMMFQFTTHSDYVIQRINQLIKLNYIRLNSSDDFTQLCKMYGLSEQNCLDKNMIKVYFFELKEDGKIDVEDLNINDKGIPMVTFFDVVKNMTSFEDHLDNVMEKIQSENADS